MSFKKTPLYNIHKKLNAKMAPFGEWEMPIQYSSIIDERNFCREKAVVFDTCHMGEFYFKGNISETNMEYPFSISIAKIPVGKCKYGFLLNKNGGIIDDLIVYRIAEDELMMVVNAGTIANDFNTIKSSLKGDYIFENRSAITGKIDLQGPLSGNILEDYFNIDISDLKYFSFKKAVILDEEVIISRTGYTGEFGFEIYSSNDKIIEIFNSLIDNPGVKPAGLGARDMLRLEMGYSLYGSDLNEEITPVEADLKCFVDFEKDFSGKEALVKQVENGAKRIKVAFTTNSRRAPRHDYTIFFNDKEIGKVTSGLYTPFLNSGIGIGYVNELGIKEGDNLTLGDGRIKIDAVISRVPFYKNGTFRK